MAGSHAVGMDAVRAAAEVSLKRIYQLFPSKDDLVIGVLRHRTEQWTTGLEAAVGAATTPRGRLLAVFDQATFQAYLRELARAAGQLVDAALARSTRH